ncbi:cupin domain-containing protein [Xanthomonas prunicola]|uniref:cupin domain-containing protein n=1 Tax=Xanthomonas prunicola TaxID=2053930 RepID=UPI0021B36BFA|nr:cupin domain-containing protein [Xanthomonas prunicola]UXA53497.1 cupin domain-containing protein [Xanthomonas prunicola]
MGVVDTATAEHYRWGSDCDCWHLLRAGDLGVIEERMPPGSVEQRHLPNHARPFFYVLAGQAVLEMDGYRHALVAGQGVHLPPGSAHQMRNASAADLHSLVVSAPYGHGDRVSLPAASAHNEDDHA